VKEEMSTVREMYRFAFEMFLKQLGKIFQLHVMTVGLIVSVGVLFGMPIEPGIVKWTALLVGGPLVLLAVLWLLVRFTLITIRWVNTNGKALVVKGLRS
jgi:hypothetical protein